MVGKNHDLQRVVAKNEYTYEMYFWRKTQRMFSVAYFLLYAETTTHKRYPLSTASTPAPTPIQTKVKHPERQANHPPPPSAEVKNAENYNFTRPYFFMEQCLSTRTLLPSTPPTPHPQISRAQRLSQGCTNFQKSRSHLQILEAIMVT
jgi:hypothetical protein